MLLMGQEVHEIACDRSILIEDEGRSSASNIVERGPDTLGLIKQGNLSLEYIQKRSAVSS